MAKTIVARVHVDAELWRWVKAEALLQDSTTEDVVRQALMGYRNFLQTSSPFAIDRPAAPP